MFLDTGKSERTSEILDQISPSWENEAAMFSLQEHCSHKLTVGFI